MIITKKTPFTLEEIELMSEEYEYYIKVVLDLELKICSGGCILHSDSEKILIDKRSAQKDIWGGGVNMVTKDIDCNALINIKPRTGNNSIEIVSELTRTNFENLIKHFFSVYYGEQT